ILYSEILARAVRCPDPFFLAKRRWIVRRLAPDCARIELSELPKKHDATALLQEMGWEVANVHLGSGKAAAIRKHLAKLPAGWLEKAAKSAVATIEEDWEAWKKAMGAKTAAKKGAAKKGAAKKAEGKGAAAKKADAKDKGKKAKKVSGKKGSAKKAGAKKPGGKKTSAKPAEAKGGADAGA
ncbi:MAG TPA: DUF2252 family protein, partial [Thermoanaerobaculia bacterium]